MPEAMAVPFQGAEAPAIVLKDVVVERRGKRAGQLVGRSPYMQSVVVEAPEQRLGELVDVTIEAAHANSLAGRAAGETERVCA